MSAFFYGVILQWKLDLRNKGILVTYYLVPLVFFAFIGAIFASINPESKTTLIQSMTVFAVTMGTMLGAPIPLVELYSSEIKKAYKVGRVPLWTPVLNNYISAFIHLMITSTIIFFIAPIAFNAVIPENLVLYFMSLAVLIIVSLGVGTILGLFITSTSKLTMFGQLIFLPSLMLSGIMFPTRMLPDILINIGKIFPATWGFIITTSNQLDLKLFIPLIIIFSITGLLSCIKVSRIGID